MLYNLAVSFLLVVCVVLLDVQSLYGTDARHHDEAGQSPLNDLLSSDLTLPQANSHFQNDMVDHELDRRGWEALDIGTRDWRTGKQGKRGWETLKRGWEAIRRGWEPVRRGWEAFKRHGNYTRRAEDQLKQREENNLFDEYGRYQIINEHVKTPSVERTMCLCCITSGSESCCKWCQTFS